jgi:hypothetical protein
MPVLIKGFAGGATRRSSSTLPGPQSKLRMARHRRAELMLLMPPTLRRRAAASTRRRSGKAGTGCPLAAGCQVAIAKIGDDVDADLFGQQRRRVQLDRVPALGTVPYRLTVDADRLNVRCAAAA